MQTEAIDRLQEDKLHWLETVIDSFDKIHANGWNDEVAAIADFLVDEGIGMRQNFLRLWHLHWTRALAMGISSEHSKRAEKLFSLLQRGEGILRRTAELARVYADSSGHDIARLAPFEEQSRAFPIWMKECKVLLDMLGRPYPPLDWELIRECQAEYARGEGEYVEDIIARLEHGVPLVKE